MVFLMPSEVARLVLGYLKEEICPRSRDAFLEECAHLNEYLLFLKKGREYTTKINGKSLQDFLNEYTILRAMVQCEKLAPDIYQALPKFDSLFNQLQVMVDSYNTRATSQEYSNDVIISISGGETSLANLETPTNATVCSKCGVTDSPVASAVADANVRMVADTNGDNEIEVVSETSALTATADRHCQTERRLFATVGTQTDDFKSSIKGNAMRQFTTNQRLSTRSQLHVQRKANKTSLTPGDKSLYQTAESQLPLDQPNVISNCNQQTPQPAAPTPRRIEPITISKKSTSNSTTTPKRTTPTGCSGNVAKQGSSALGDILNRNHLDEESTSSSYKTPMKRSDGTPSSSVGNPSSAASDLRNEETMDSRSPRRKTPIPKKRVGDVITSTKRTAVADEGSSLGSEGESVDFAGVLERFLNNPALHECIADNINKAVAATTPGPGHLTDTEPVSLTQIKPTLLIEPDLHVPDSMIKEIAAKTGTDPVFEAMLMTIFSKNDSQLPTARELEEFSNQSTPLSLATANPLSVAPAVAPKPPGMLPVDGDLSQQTYESRDQPVGSVSYSDSGVPTPSSFAGVLKEKTVTFILPEKDRFANQVSNPSSVMSTRTISTPDKDQEERGLNGNDDIISEVLEPILPDTIETSLPPSTDFQDTSIRNTNSVGVVPQTPSCELEEPARVSAEMVNHPVEPREEISQSSGVPNVLPSISHGISDSSNGVLNSANQVGDRLTELSNEEEVETAVAAICGHSPRTAFGERVVDERNGAMDLPVATPVSFGDTTPTTSPADKEQDVYTPRTALAHILGDNQAIVGEEFQCVEIYGTDGTVQRLPVSNLHLVNTTQIAMPQAAFYATNQVYTGYPVLQPASTFTNFQSAQMQQIRNLSRQQNELNQQQNAFNKQQIGFNYQHEAMQVVRLGGQFQRLAEGVGQSGAYTRSQVEGAATDKPLSKKELAKLKRAAKKASGKGARKSKEVATPTPAAQAASQTNNNHGPIQSLPIKPNTRLSGVTVREFTKGVKLQISNGIVQKQEKISGELFRNPPLAKRPVKAPAAEPAANRYVEIQPRIERPADEKAAMTATGRCGGANGGGPEKQLFAVSCVQQVKQQVNLATCSASNRSSTSAAAQSTPKQAIAPREKPLSRENLMTVINQQIRQQSNTAGKPVGQTAISPQLSNLLTKVQQLNGSHVRQIFVDESSTPDGLARSPVRTASERSPPKILAKNRPPRTLVSESSIEKHDLTVSYDLGLNSAIAAAAAPPNENLFAMASRPLGFERGTKQAATTPSHVLVDMDNSSNSNLPYKKRGRGGQKVVGEPAVSTPPPAEVVNMMSPPVEEPKTARRGRKRKNESQAKKSERPLKHLRSGDKQLRSATKKTQQMLSDLDVDKFLSAIHDN